MPMGDGIRRSVATISQEERNRLRDAIIDAGFQLRFRSPVPIEHATRLLERTAEWTNVTLVTLIYGHFVA